MNFPCLSFVAGLAALVSLAQGQTAPQPAPAKAKTVKPSWTPPRAADGHPDLQGFWSNNTATPLERPKALGDKATLTDEELAAFKKKAAELFDGKGDAAFGDNVFQAVLDNVNGAKKGFVSTDGNTGDYSSVWTVQRVWDHRTSQITDPPDGRMPAMTPEGQKRREANLAARTGVAAGPEDRSLQERCITYGSPQLTTGYQSYYQILQTPGTVLFLTEMIHDVRLIPLSGHPHIPSTIRHWLGDSRGHWEGDTLVVDTTNYKPRSFMGVSSEQLHVTERFSRTGPETLQYEITINDPGTWSKPWSLMVPWRRSDKPVYEYACHEGNIGLEGILSGARAEERAAGLASQTK
ncbi:MAG: hypothetical protein EXQ47_04020 [Bryobacterales bacterium]|nr:hypothetical protein [Bryobacterales bacterium]